MVMHQVKDWLSEIDCATDGTELEVRQVNANSCDVTRHRSYLRSQRAADVLGGYIVPEHVTTGGGTT